jgi:hypothetical protein
MTFNEYDLSSGVGWASVAGMTIFWLGVIAFVVWLVGVISAKLHSIILIKAVHTVVFVLLSGLLAVYLYEVIADKITFITWVAVTLFLAEGVVLIVNGWRCPLTTMAENLGSPHGQITDIFLPKWFADRVFLVYSGLFVAALLLLLVRLFTGGRYA